MALLYLDEAKLSKVSTKVTYGLTWLLFVSVVPYRPSGVSTWVRIARIGL